MSLAAVAPELAHARALATANILAYESAALIADEVAASIYTVTSKTAKTVAAFAQAVHNRVGDIEAELVDVHRQIAEQAQEAIVASYLQSLHGTPTYRTSPVHERNRRYAGGILQSILESTGFVSYDEHGVYVGNTAMLDAGARQWRRLNYGAGGAAGGSAAIIAARFSNLEIILEESGSARPGFTLPAGRWVGNAFYPYSELTAVDAPWRRSHLASHAFSHGERQGATMTRGIRGEHWLAAGLRVVASQLAEQYTNLFKRLWAEADEEARAQLAGDTGLKRPTSGRKVALDLEGNQSGSWSQESGFPSREAIGGRGALSEGNTEWYGQP